LSELVISIASHPGGPLEEHRRLLDNCVASLHRTIRHTAYRVVLINNLQHVDLFSGLTQLRGDEELVTNAGPLGFAANHNQILRLADEPFALILNDDTVALDGCVDGLVDTLRRRPEVAAVGPNMFVDDALSERQPSAGFRVITPERAALWRWMRETPLIGMPALRWIYSELDTPNADCEVLHLQGAAFVVRRDAYWHVGGMDESFGMYREETDLCLKLGRAGWKLLHLPAHSLVHYGGKSTQGSAYRQEYQDSLNLFLRRYFGWRSVLVNGWLEPLGMKAVRALRALFGKKTRP
jgi:GT2 family glycosyltransferase